LDEFAPVIEVYAFPNSCVVLLSSSQLLARSLKPPIEIIVVKRLIQRRKNTTRVRWVESRSYD